jgi:hypothetical protein
LAWRTKDRKDSPDLIATAEHPDRNLSPYSAEYFCVSGLNSRRFFASFARFAVQLQFSG